MRPPWLAAVHWATAGLILVGVTAVLIRQGVEAKTGRAWLLAVHRWCGVLILGLTAWRVVLRAWFAPLPDLLPSRRAPARIAAGVVHASLYALLAAVPVLGWSSLGVNDEELADKLHDVHIALACTLIFLIALHAAAACWHQFIRREPVVNAMWPLSVKKQGDTP